MKLSSLLSVGSLLLVLFLGVLMLSGGQSPAPPAASPSSIDVEQPQEPDEDPDSPCPGPNCPKRPRRPWRNRREAAVGSLGLVNGRQHEGEGVTCDFPPSLWMANIGSKVDGAGMCVATSVEMTSRYLSLRRLAGFRDWCAKEPGGADPQKIEEQLKRFCKQKRVAVPAYLNVVTPKPESLLASLDAAGLPYAHGYYQCPRYAKAGNPRGKIAHMVFSVKYRGKYAVIVDNNEIGGVSQQGGRIFEWVPKAEAISRMKSHGNAWIFAFLVPPPPPCPRS